MAAKIRVKKESQKAASREWASRRLWPAGLILLLTFITYWPALHAGFVWDDNQYVTENPALKTAGGLHQIWMNPRASVQYYPLVFTTFWIEYHLWKLAPFGYHLINILLQGTGAVLLWRVLVRLKIPGALLAAMVFAIHPVHVESVAWVTERKNVLSGAFCFGALLLYLGFLEQNEPGKRKWGRYVLAMLLFSAALLSKTATCALPLSILIIIWWQRGRLALPDAVRVAPMVVLAALSGFATVYVESHHVAGEAGGREWAFGAIGKGLVAGRALWFYLGKLIWPTHICFVYPRWVIDTSQWWQYLFPAAFAALLAALWLARRRIGRGPLAAMLLFAVNLAPALGLISVYYMRYSWVADHFQYLASIGPIVLLSAVATLAVPWIVRHVGLAETDEGVRKVQTGLACVLLTALALISWRQCGAYRDIETLWRTTVRVNPGAWMAHANLGNCLAEQGRVDEAMASWREALRLYPADFASHNMLASALTDCGQTDEAIQHLEEALRLNPALPTTYGNYGLVLKRKGDLEGAARKYQAGLKLSPGDAMFLTNLASVLIEQGKRAEAIVKLRAAVTARPDLTLPRQKLAALLAQERDLRGAVEQASALVQLEPGNVDFRVQLGDMHLQGGATRQAILVYREALERDRHSLAAAVKLAWIEAAHPDPALRNGAEAVQLAEQAAKATHYQNATVLDILAAAYAEAGRFPDAVNVQRRALSLQSDPAAKAEGEKRLKLYEAQQPFRLEQ